MKKIFLSQLNQDIILNLFQKKNFLYLKGVILFN